MKALEYLRSVKPWVAAGVACMALAGCEAAKVTETDTVGGDVTVQKSTHKIYVFDTIGFTKVTMDDQKVQHAPGFNLDNTVSGTDDDNSCNHTDFLSPDGIPGIDNQFATLVPLMELTRISAVETLLQSSIESGGILLLFEFEGLDDLVNDPSVNMRVRAANGSPLLGTDGKLLTGQTFHVSPRDPNVNAGTAVVKDGIVTAGPFDIDLPVQVFGKDYTLEARGTFVKFRIIDEERISDGILGTGVTISSVRTLAKKAAEGEGDILPIVESLVNGQGDLVKKLVHHDCTPDQTDCTPGDFMECTQMSATLQFTGVSAYFFPQDVTGTVAP